jgi:hypothetical protein
VHLPAVNVLRFSVFVRLTADQTYVSIRLNYLASKSYSRGTILYLDHWQFLWPLWICHISCFFFVHERQDLLKNVSDKMDIFFSTVAWSIWNPPKIRRGVNKFCWPLCKDIIMRFELNFNVVDMLLKVPTIHIHKKYVQWGRVVSWDGLTCLRFFICVTVCEGAQQTEAPSEHQSLCSDGHLPVRRKHGYRFYNGEEITFI